MVSHQEPFDFSDSADHPRWIRWFESFRLASGLSEKPEEYQINSLFYAIGDGADNILGILTLSESERKKYECVVEVFR